MQKLTQVEFYKVCEYVKGNADELRRLAQKDLPAIVSNETGIDINRRHLHKIQEATGIDWLVNDRKRQEIRQSEAVRILACSVAALYRDHEREIPEGLAQLAAEGFTLEGGGE